MAASMSVEKNKFIPRDFFTTSSNPGSYIGRLSLSHAAMRPGLMSTTVTLISGHFAAITAMVGPPTYPAPMQVICLLNAFFAITLSPFAVNYFVEKMMSAMSLRTPSIACVSGFLAGNV